MLLAPTAPIIAGAIMVAVVAAARTALPAGLPRIGDLAILIAVGVSTYFIVLLSLFRSLAIEVYRVVRR